MRPNVFCPLVLSLLAIGAIASADPPKPAGGQAAPQVASPKPTAATPKPIRRVTRGKFALSASDRLAVVKAVNSAAEVYAKDKDKKKLFEAGRGLRGDSQLAFTQAALGIISAGTPPATSQLAAHYSIESGRVLSIARNSGTCLYTADIEVTIKNTGAAVPSNVSPKLDGSSMFFPYEAPVPRLGAGGTTTVTLPTLVRLGERSQSGSCSGDSLTVHLAFTGVASFNTFVLELGLDGDATVTAVPPNTDEGGTNGFGLPPCAGMRKCGDGSCVPMSLPCSTF